MENFDWDSLIKEATRYKPYASLWIDKESDRVELLLDTNTNTYHEWIKGEGADISLVRCSKTNKVIGINLPLYQTDFSIFHSDGIKVRINEGYLKNEKTAFQSFKNKFHMNYRFLFEIEHENKPLNIGHLVESVNVDYLKREISLNLYQARLEDGTKDGTIASSLVTKKLREGSNSIAFLSTFNKDGTLFYKIRFNKLFIHNTLSTSYSYNNSRPSVDSLLLYFEDFVDCNGYLEIESRGSRMTKPTLAEDIGIAISCVQDYLDTIDRPYRRSSVEEQEHYDTIRLRIERLMQFYYQLTGFDPNGEKK